jgi:hypothetical protein
MRSIHKVAKSLARKQLNGKDIRSKVLSECEHNSFDIDSMRKLIVEYYEIERGKLEWRK